MQVEISASPALVIAASFFPFVHFLFKEVQKAFIASVLRQEVIVTFLDLQLPMGSDILRQQLRFPVVLSFRFALRSLVEKKLQEFPAGRLAGIRMDDGGIEVEVQA